MTSINQNSPAAVRTETGDQVIQTAHVFTKAHRAIKGTEGPEREARRNARKEAEKKLLSACDADNRGRK